MDPFFGIYRLLPDWGPVRHFDSYGDEALRVRQLQISEHAARVRQVQINERNVAVGSWPRPPGSGAAPWGQPPPGSTTHVQPHPVHGTCRVRQAQSLEERLREASAGGWAVDESHLLRAQGVQSRPLRMNESHFCARARLV